MIDLKKKCWREKITAEVTVAHVQQFARELRINLSAAEAAAFLNEKGRAQAVWTRMMQAGEEFLKADLANRNGFAVVERSVIRTAPSAGPHKTMRPASASYQ